MNSSSLNCKCVKYALANERICRLLFGIASFFSFVRPNKKNWPNPFFSLVCSRTPHKRPLNCGIILNSQFIELVYFINQFNKNLYRFDLNVGNATWFRFEMLKNHIKRMNDDGNSDKIRFVFCRTIIALHLTQLDVVILVAFESIRNVFWVFEKNAFFIIQNGIHHTNSIETVSLFFLVIDSFLSLSTLAPVCLWIFDKYLF